MKVFQRSQSRQRLAASGANLRAPAAQPGKEGLGMAGDKPRFGPETLAKRARCTSSVSAGLE